MLKTSPIIYICHHKKLDQMITYTLGWFLFLVIFLMGFGMLIFLSLFIGYWLTLISIEQINPKLAHKIIGHKESE